MYGSDMDQTMILNDSGALVFMEYLRSPDFYRFSPRELHDALVPDIETGTTTPRQFLEEGAAGRIEGVLQADCALALRMREDIVAAYAVLQDAMRSSTQTADTAVKLGAFMRLILEFDSLLIRLKNQHPCSATANLLAAALSRFRLFGGQTTETMEAAALQLLAVTEDHPERFFEARAGDAAHSKLDRVVQANAPIHALLRDLHERQGAEGVVVTATPAEIARTIIRDSVYRALIPDDRIIATRLAKTACGTRFNGRLDGGMVAGVGKTRLLEERTAAVGRTIKLVLGDLPGSDAHMGAMALDNGGVFVVTHAPGAYEQTRAGFDTFLTRIMGKTKLDGAQERIWYVEASPMPLNGAAH